MFADVEGTGSRLIEDELCGIDCAVMALSMALILCSAELGTDGRAFGPPSWAIKRSALVEELD